MPHERAAILLGCLLGARVLPRNSTLQRQGIDQGMLASGGLLPLTGTLVIYILGKLYKKGFQAELAWLRESLVSCGCSSSEIWQRTSVRLNSVLRCSRHNESQLAA